MLSSDTPPPAALSNDLILNVLENTESGVAVLERSGASVFLNASLRRLFSVEGNALPIWCHDPLRQMLEQMRTGSDHLVERWVHEHVTYRVRGRVLDTWSGRVMLEVSVASLNTDQGVAEVLGKSLKLGHTDAQLLELLWRGLSNDEIAGQLNVRIGTVKSRLFRLYQKLGVRRRPAAVLRAAEIISG